MVEAYHPAESLVESAGLEPAEEGMPRESDRTETEPSEVDSRKPADRDSPLVGSPLVQRERESERAHRAFLLWAMQSPESRNVSAAARAVGRAEGTAREWRRRWSWDDRIGSIGEASDAAATAAYREWYYPKWKLREVVEVEDFLAAPFRPEAVVAPSVVAEVREAIRGDGKREAEAEARRKSRRRHRALVDGAIGLVAKRVAAGEVRVSLRDIPTLLDLRERLDDGGAASGHGGVVVESVRVRLARETGSDVVAALHEDALELTAILGAIRSTSEVPDRLLRPGSSETDA